MEPTGAVDLSLEVSEIAMPEEDLVSRDLIRIADRYGFSIPPALWLRVQLTRLAAASVLEARLLHVRAERLGFFDLVPDPEVVKLQQLAPLHLEHHGTAGQAFELAVADAVCVGHPEVTGLIRAGLRQLNLPADGPLSMVVLGMEKVPSGRREQFWADVRSILPADGKLRTGMRGRPASTETAVSRLAAMTAQTLHQPRQDYPPTPRQTEYRDSVSQLGRADALIACGADLVAASLKINHLSARNETWRDVPLWITVGSQAGVHDWRAHGESRRSPRVTVTLPSEGWFAVFRDALEAVDVALNHINRGVGFPRNDFTLGSFQTPVAGARVSTAVARTLWQWRREPIAAVTEELRKAPMELLDSVGQFDLSRDLVEVTSLDVPELVTSLREDSASARLFMTQQHLFRHLVGFERQLIAG